MIKLIETYQDGKVAIEAFPRPEHLRLLRYTATEAVERTIEAFDGALEAHQDESFRVEILFFILFFLNPV